MNRRSFLIGFVGVGTVSNPGTERINVQQSGYYQMTTAKSERGCKVITATAEDGRHVEIVVDDKDGIFPDHWEELKRMGLL